MQLPDPFLDAEGRRWAVQPHLRRAPRGTIEAWLRFVGEDGRVMSSGPIALAEDGSYLAGWESALAAPKIAAAFARAHLDGAFARYARGVMALT